MKESGARVVSVLTSRDNVPPGYREVYIRIQDMADQELEAMKEAIGKKYKLLYVIKEDTLSVPTKS